MVSSNVSISPRLLSSKSVFALLSSVQSRADLNILVGGGGGRVILRVERDELAGCSSECLSLALNVHHTNNTIVSWVYSLDPSNWPTSVSKGVIVFEEDYITLAEGVVA